MATADPLDIDDAVAALVGTWGVAGLCRRLRLAPGSGGDDVSALRATIDGTPWLAARLQRLMWFQQRVAPGRGRRAHGNDLRGVATAIVRGTTGVTGVVEDMHDAIGAVPIITDLMYRVVRGVTALVGESVDAVVAGLTPFLGASTPGAEREAVVAALNGVVGDYLAQSGNPLAIEMALRPPLQGLHDGQVLLVLVHGSCATDLMWRWDGHDHGAALAVDLGFTPIYAHYNSGLHVSDNGAALSALIEATAGAFEHVVVLAHSMGGLVSRSALQVGSVAGHGWVAKVQALVTLGSPHEGAPLERGGNVIESLFGVTPWTAPLQTLARVRSAGITDMRHGNVVPEDWQGADRFQRGPDPRTSTPLPEGLRTYAVAATASPDGTAIDDLAGDTLVPVASALGQHDNDRFQLRFTATRIVYGTRHLGLLSSQAVYRQLVEWLQDLAVAPITRDVDDAGLAHVAGADGGADITAESVEADLGLATPEGAHNHADDEADEVGDEGGAATADDGPRDL